MSHNNHHEHEEKNDFNTVSDMPWFRPWLLVAFLALIIFMLVRGCKETFKYETLTTTATPNANAHGEHSEATTVANERDATTIAKESGYEFITYAIDKDTMIINLEKNEFKTFDSPISIVHLPNNTTLKTKRNSIEEKLAIYLNNPASVVDKTTWFDFDDLRFQTGKVDIELGQEAPLARIAQLLKAYPKVKLKIGAYTDNTGDSLKNMALSTGRAKTAVKELGLIGIAADRLTAEGYGPQHPIADNATEEGRSKNRRVSVRVTEK